MSSTNNVWVIGTNPVDGGYGIWHLTDSGWQAVQGGAVGIAVGPDGHPWVINNRGTIYQHTENRGWVPLQGAAKDIAVGSDGSVWVIGTNPVDGGYGIWHLTDSGWQAVQGGAVGIAVGPDGHPWVINNRGTIYQHTENRGWVPLQGAAKDIGVLSLEDSDNNFRTVNDSQWYNLSPDSEKVIPPQQSDLLDQPGIVQENVLQEAEYPFEMDKGDDLVHQYQVGSPDIDRLNLVDESYDIDNDFLATNDISRLYKNGFQCLGTREISSHLEVNLGGSDIVSEISCEPNSLFGDAVSNQATFWGAGEPLVSQIT